jgi:MucR family transcriptional regulator, transcriptional regulator of exopolysaccharide biosynthesis
MAEEDWPPAVDPYQVAEIVSSYVRHHKIEPDQLVGLIVEVHRALASLGRGASPAQEPPKPAVPIRRSVRRDYVVCLECGFRAQTLRRHLRVQHGLKVAQYRLRWNFMPDHPVTAPAYSERRSAMAKQIGLGRHRAPAEPPAAPRRRGRPRRSSTTSPLS